ncbi:ABC transporter permease [uncultured Flavonifractor sp.]|uniref:ABC transporter permease n=1 Tax=uncultured Flavonifractor sp. TaxID=1193534 RepID=UPI00267094AF|nr:ABC transporter permease [uncultured Flavonifractor sp.]
MKKIEVSKLLPVIMLIVLIVIGSQLSESFFTLSNLSNIVQYAVESAFIGIGMTFVLLIGGIDLSVGSVLAFASVVSAKMALESMSIPLILIVVIPIGLGCGAVNGLLVTRFRIEPFMATLAMMMIMRACTFLFTGGGPLTGSVQDSFKQIIKGDFLGVQNGIWYVLIAFVAAFLILDRTRFGRHIYAVGGGEETAKLFGVQTDRVKLCAYMISGLLAALSGLFIAARIGIGEPRSGQSYEMTAITICVVGGISMLGGKGNILGTFVGTMVVCMISNLMNLMNIDTNAQPIVTGIIILVTTLIVSREVGKSRKHLVKEI